MRSRREIVPVAASKREVVLKPKKCGLTGKNKPVVFIVSSPHDAVDASTKYTNTFAFLESAGYGVINKRSCFWNTDESELAARIKPVSRRGAPLTIWIEAHGALGWFFAGGKDAKEEFIETLKFVQFIRKIAEITHSSLDTVVLNGCFTANEFFNEATHNFNLSPARMLSILAPDIQVIGFIGKNATAKVTGIFEKKKDGSYNPLSLNPEEASVLYKEGTAIECFTRTFYCNHKYTHTFMAELLDIEEEDSYNEDSFYPVHDVVHYMATHDIAGIGYGAQQRAWASTLSTAEEVLDDEEEVPAAALRV